MNLPHKIGATLEKHVLQIVSQTSSLSRFMLAACMHSNECLNAWLIVVLCHVDFQAILQCVDFGLQHITFHGFILVLEFLATGQE